jgi:diadenosine tetraphosphate (Ap4A) HIT family hydrolase
MNGCMACDVFEGRLQPPGGRIHEGDQWIVDHSLSPVRLKGWLLLKPKRHVEAFADLTLDEAAALGPLAAAVAAALTRAVAPERVYVCSFGEEVRHVHIHVVPRYRGMDAVSYEVLERMWSEQSPWACGDEEAEAVAAAVRAELA